MPAMSWRYDKIEIGGLFAECLQLLERIAACDARLEACFKEGPGEELGHMVRERQQALDQLKALGERIEKLDGAGTPNCDRIRSLRGEVQRMAELAVTRSGIYVAKAKELISALEREMSIVQNEGTLLRRYVGHAGHQTEFNG